MRLIKKFDFGRNAAFFKSIRVDYDSENEEYQVRFVATKTGKVDGAFTYYTDDKEDAIDTAQYEFNKRNNKAHLRRVMEIAALKEFAADE